MPVSFPHFCLIVNSPWCPGGNSGTSLSTRQNTCVRMSLVWVLEGLWHGAVVERDAVGPHVVASSGARPSWQIRTMALSGHPPHATYTTAQHNTPHPWATLGEGNGAGWGKKVLAGVGGLQKRGGGASAVRVDLAAKRPKIRLGCNFSAKVGANICPFVGHFLTTFFCFQTKQNITQDAQRDHTTSTAG